MKMTIRFLLILMTMAFVQSSENKYLFWKPGAKLKWTDFQGHVKPDDDAAASASYIGFFHKIKKSSHPDTIVPDARAFFNKSKSWVKVPAVTPSLLAHEQLHFDLAELYSRKFRKAISELNITPGTLVRCVDSTYKYYAGAGDNIHFLYDTETNHGLNMTGQFKWTEKIKTDLQELTKFESPFLRIFIGK
jgi:hypothetical protein